MGLIQLPNRRIRRDFKPDFPIEIDYSHPYAQRLVAAYVLTEGVGYPRNLATGGRLNAGAASTTWGTNKSGRILLNTSSTLYESLLPNTNLDTGKFTWIWRGRTNSSYQQLFQYAIAGYGWQVRTANWSSTASKFAVYAVHGGGYSVTPNSWDISATHTHAMAVNGPAGTFRYFFDGIYRTTTSGLVVESPSGHGSTRNVGINIGALRNSFMFVFDDVLPDDAVISISSNPWQLVRPIKLSRIWLPLGVGGGGGSVTLSGLDLTLTLGSITLGRSVALAGSSITTTLGTSSPSTKVYPAGINLTTTLGSVVLGRSVALNGLNLTVSLGSVSTTSPVRVALSGIALTVSLGSVTTKTAVTASGLDLALALGTVTVRSAVIKQVTVSGIDITVSLGAVTVTSIPVVVTPPVLTTFRKLPIGNVPRTQTPNDTVRDIKDLYSTAHLLARQVAVLKGPTSARPTLGPEDTGVQYFDTDLAAGGKPIWWTGTDWVDHTGAIV